MATFISDLANTFQGGNAIQPGTSLTTNGGTTTLVWVDVSDTDGPVHAVCMTGTTGSSESFTVTYQVQEADDSSGTNSQNISGASGTVSAGESDTVITTGLRSKPFIGVQATLAVSSDSSSSTNIEVASHAFGIKKHV